MFMNPFFMFFIESREQNTTHCHWMQSVEFQTCFLYSHGKNPWQKSGSAPGKVCHCPSKIAFASKEVGFKVGPTSATAAWEKETWSLKPWMIGILKHNPFQEKNCPFCISVIIRFVVFFQKNSKCPPKSLRFFRSEFILISKDHSFFGSLKAFVCFVLLMVQKSGDRQLRWVV